MESSLPEPVYEQIERGLADWARGRSDVLAVMVIGSRARRQNPADRWSDLDTILFVKDPAVFHSAGAWQTDLEAALGRTAWFAAFGWTLGDPEWEYVLEGGVKVDLVFTANQAQPTGGGPPRPMEMADASPYRFVFERGTRVLYDSGRAEDGGRAENGENYGSKTGYAQEVNTPAPPGPPDQPAFDNRIANALLELVRAAKIGQRGERYRAARILNADFQDQLLALIELHARGRHRPGADWWGYGRFLEQWADPRAAAALPGTHALPTAESIRRAVLAGLDLLEWLGPEAAQGLGLRFPERMLRPTAGWLRQFLEYNHITT